MAEDSPQDTRPEGASVPPLESGATESIDSVVIARPRADVYAFWRDFTNAPRFMQRVRRVTEVDALSSLWTVVDADGHEAEWEFLVTDDERDRLIAWSTSGHTPVRYRGRVEFSDASPGPGTQVTAIIRQDPPEGIIGTLLARVSAAAAPILQRRGDLERLKALLDSGAPVRPRPVAPDAPDAPERAGGVIAPEWDEQDSGQP